MPSSTENQTLQWEQIELIRRYFISYVKLGDGVSCDNVTIEILKYIDYPLENLNISRQEMIERNFPFTGVELEEFIRQEITRDNYKTIITLSNEKILTIRNFLINKGFTTEKTFRIGWFFRIKIFFKKIYNKLIGLVASLILWLIKKIFDNM
jgi:hypothetical protein